MASTLFCKSSEQPAFSAHHYRWKVMRLVLYSLWGKWLIFISAYGLMKYWWRAGSGVSPEVSQLVPAEDKQIKINIFIHSRKSWTIWGIINKQHHSLPPAVAGNSSHLFHVNRPSLVYIHPSIPLCVCSFVYPASLCPHLLSWFSLMCTVFYHFGLFGLNLFARCVWVHTPVVPSCFRGQSKTTN